MRSLICLGVLLATVGHAAAEPRRPTAEVPAAAPAPLALQYELRRDLSLGIRLSIAPGVLLRRGRRPIGVTTYVKLEAIHGLVVVKTDVTSAPCDRSIPTWAVAVHLGGELKPGELAMQLLGPVRAAIRRAL